VDGRDETIVMVRRSEARLLPTAGEHKLLEILWRIREGTIEDVIEAAEQSPRPNYKTVQTMLRIMEGKKLVTHRVRGRAFVYQPRVARNRIGRLSIRSLLDRHFGGSRSELLLNLLDDEPIDPAELKDLEELIRHRREAKRSSRR
jgi:BlaI family transcriptional regulator, penicillinase repressor